MTKSSDRYEHVTRFIFNSLREQFGYESVEGNTHLHGKISEGLRQIDVTVYKGDKQIIVECKRHKTKVDIKTMGEFVFMIEDVGADGGIIVSAAGFSKRAEKIAKSKKIKTAILNLDATEDDYILKFGEHLWRGISFIDTVPVSDEALCTTIASYVDIVPVSDEGHLESIPIQEDSLE